MRKSGENGWMNENAMWGEGDLLEKMCLVSFEGLYLKMSFKYKTYSLKQVVSIKK